MAVSSITSNRVSTTSTDSTGIDFKKVADCFDGLTAESHKFTPDTSRFMFYSEQTGAIHEPSLSQIKLSLYGTSTIEILKTPFWIDITDPTPEEMILLKNAFDIHPLTMEDIQAGDTRQKSDMFKNYTFIVIKAVDDKEYYNTIESIQISILLFNDCILSFQTTRNQHANTVLERLQHEKEITPDYICYMLIDDITNHYVPLMRYLEREVDMIDELVLILKASNLVDMLQRISQARKKVMLLGRWVNNKPDLIRLITNRFRRPNNDLQLHMEDVYDCAITMKQDIQQFDATLARSHSHYLAQISIEITQASNRGNEMTTKMTILASILVPLNIITGLWGMNVHVPGQDDQSSHNWFFGIIGLMVVISAATSWFIWIMKVQGSKTE